MERNSEFSFANKSESVLLRDDKTGDFPKNDTITSSVSNPGYREEMISSEEQALLQLLQRGIAETTEENVAFTKEILPLLRQLNLEPQTLSDDIKEGLQKVALILRAEKLFDFDETTMKIAMERKNFEERKRLREEKHLTLTQDHLFRKYSNFLKKLERLGSAVNSLEDFVENSQKDQDDIYCNRVLLSSKLMEYQRTVEKLEYEMIDMEIEDLYPEKILNKYQKYLEMSGELAELNESLHQYADLPPNILQAKALLESKKKEYEIVEKAFLERTNHP